MRFNHGKFAMGDVLVTHDCLNSNAVAVLASSGAQALQRGEMVTDWRSVSSAFNEMEAWSDIPAGASIKVAVETGDGENDVVDSRTVELKSGKQTISLAGLKLGEKVRLNIQLTATRWGDLPVLHTVLLQNMNEAVRWAVLAEWQKGSQTGGLEIVK
jgi:hypothetical protein